MTVSTDLLYSIIGFLILSVISLVTFIARNMLGRQKNLSMKLGEVEKKVISLEHHVAKIETDIIGIKETSETAMEVTREIEGNYIKRFDGLTLEMEKTRHVLLTQFQNSIGGLSLDIAEMKTNNEEKYQRKGDCDKIMDKVTRELAGR